MPILLTSEEQVCSQIILCLGQQNFPPETQALLEAELLPKQHKANFLLPQVKEGKLWQQFYLYLDASVSDELLRQALCLAVKECKKGKDTDFSLLFQGEVDSDTEQRLLRLLGEVFYLLTYQFIGYKKDAKPAKEISLLVRSTLGKDSFETAVAEGQHLAVGVNIARDSINMPSDVMTPQAFADLSQDCGQKFGFETEVLQEATLKEMGFSALLAVGQGSLNPSVLVTLKYQGDPSSQEYTALVGKGVTFDSGGYCLKGTDTIAFMKVDMGGAAAVLGAVSALAQNKVKTNVLAVLPLCENLIGKEALIPGSVISTLSKKTVEITNTDAEGRLILADGLFYASQQAQVSRIIDIATLTGATAVTFGGLFAGVTSNNPSFLAELQEASQACGERIWELPLHEAFKDKIVSKIADYRNSSPTKSAGTIVAGMFLKEFVGEKPWIHIDIAGITVAMGESHYNVPGPTGFGVRMIYQLLSLPPKD